VVAGAVVAQVPRPGEEPLPLPEFEAPEAPQPVIPAPPVLPEPAPEAPDAVRIEIKGFVFEGNKVFSDQQLSAVAEAYLGTSARLRSALERFFAACSADLESPERQAKLAQLADLAAGDRFLSMAQLLELRRLLTILYVDCGYITSGAILPDQRIIEGVVTFQVVEGHLAQINVFGTGRLREGYVRRRLELGAGPPLNINQFQDRFRILLQDPQIERMNARLGPGTRLGESILDVDVTPARPVDISFIADNHRPPSIGAEEGLTDWTVRNLTGFGDTFGLEFGAGEGGPKVDASWELPLTPRDTTFRARFRYDDAQVVESPLDELDIDSESWTVEAGLSQPFRTPTQELMLEGRIERRHSQTKLLDRPFSFSPGVIKGESDITVLRAVQQFTDRGPERVIAARSTLSFGLEAFDATHNAGDLPDGQYFAWLGQARMAKRWRVGDTRAPSARGDSDGPAWPPAFCRDSWLEWHCRQGVQLILRGDIQIADDPLLPLEKFGVGGATTVRGYIENQFVRDNGIVASIEARLPLYPLPLPLGRGETATLQLAPFFDYGQSWNYKESKDDISSVGVGLVWEPAPWLSAQVYWGYALQSVFDPTDDYLQDHGISFMVVLRATDAVDQPP
jgi:hemolysin activation/secretion protein